MEENYIVLVVESDFYARNAINSYLAWDRRTRVVNRLASLTELFSYLGKTTWVELPDTILMDSLLVPTAEDIQHVLTQISTYCPADVIVMAHQPSLELAQAVRSAGGKGYANREDVGLQVAWMVGWSKQYEFVLTESIAHFFEDAAILPHRREYPELTERVRQALMLCVVEGMSAELAANEMGLSPHTIRSYIKEGYSILEANSDLDYPSELSPQEKAFMRFTALALQDEHNEQAKRTNPTKKKRISS